MAGIVGILLFEVCVWGAVKLRRRRMQKPAATEGKEGIRFVSMVLITSMHDTSYSVHCNAICTILLMQELMSFELAFCNASLQR